MNGNNMKMTPAELLEKIRELSFVCDELELYLDTHPTCRAALDYYHDTVDTLTELRETYHANYGPLVKAGSISPDKWTWIDTPWPWQRESDVGKKKEV